MYIALTSNSRWIANLKVDSSLNCLKAERFNKRQICKHEKRAVLFVYFHAYIPAWSGYIWTETWLSHWGQRKSHPHSEHCRHAVWRQNTCSSVFSMQSSFVLKQHDLNCKWWRVVAEIILKVTIVVLSRWNAVQTSRMHRLPDSGCQQNIYKLHFANLGKITHT